MDNNLRFQWYVVALRQFASREGHCRVPALHVEVLEGMEVKLGSFVSYQRQRRRKLREDLNLAQNRGDLEAVRKLESTMRKFKEREEELEAIAGFLLEHETIGFEQFEAIIDGKDPLLASPMAADKPSSSEDPPVPTNETQKEVSDSVDPEPQAT